MASNAAPLHRVVLRIKRKRSDAPVDSLLVAADDDGPAGKRRQLSLESSFAALSTRATASADSASAEPGGTLDAGESRSALVFKRVAPAAVGAAFSPPPTAAAPAVEATEATTSSPSFPAAPGPLPHFLEVRRSLARPKPLPDDLSAGPAGEGAPAQAGPAGGTAAAPPARAPSSPEYHVIDLVALRSRGAAGGGGATADLACNGQPLRRAVTVLSPLDRAMDEAIAVAFAVGDMSKLWEALAMGANVNYQRSQSAHRTTALMAAACRGDVAATRRLLLLGANPCLVDAQGNDAADLALRGGHGLVVGLLQRAATAAGAAGSQDYVYDLYWCSGEEAPAPAAQAAETSDAGSAGPAAPPFDGSSSVSSSSHSSYSRLPLVRLGGVTALTREVGGMAADPLELQFESDEEWSRRANGEDDQLGSETSDSNDENFYANDYPDEGAAFVGGSGDEEEEEEEEGDELEESPGEDPDSSGDENAGAAAAALRGMGLRAPAGDWLPAMARQAASTAAAGGSDDGSDGGGGGSDEEDWLHYGVASGAPHGDRDADSHEVVDMLADEDDEDEDVDADL